MDCLRKQKCFRVFSGFGSIGKMIHERHSDGELKGSVCVTIVFEKKQYI